MGIDINAESNKAVFIDKIAETIRKNLAKYLEKIELLDDYDGKDMLLAYLELMNIDKKEAIRLIKKEIDFEKEEPQSSSLVIRLRELFKSRDDSANKYITLEELQKKYSNVTKEELEKTIKQMLENGEIYEPSPSFLRWLG